MLAGLIAAGGAAGDDAGGAAGGAPADEVGGVDPSGEQVVVGASPPVELPHDEDPAGGGAPLAPPAMVPKELDTHPVVNCTAAPLAVPLHDPAGVVIVTGNKLLHETVNTANIPIIIGIKVLNFSSLNRSISPSYAKELRRWDRPFMQEKSFMA